MSVEELEKAKEEMIADVARLGDLTAGEWSGFINSDYVICDLSSMLQKTVFIDTDDEALSVSRCQNLMKDIVSAFETKNAKEALSDYAKLCDALCAIAVLADIPGRRTPRKISDKLLKVTTDGLSGIWRDCDRELTWLRDKQTIPGISGMRSSPVSAWDGIAPVKESEVRRISETLTDLFTLFEDKRITAAYRRRLGKATGEDIAALISRRPDKRIKAVKKLLREAVAEVLKSKTLPKSTRYMILSTDLSEGENTYATDGDAGIFYGLGQTINAYRAVILYCRKRIQDRAKVKETNEKELARLAGEREKVSSENTTRIDRETERIKRTIADAARFVERHEEVLSSVTSNLDVAQKAYAEKDSATAEKLLTPDVSEDILGKAAPWRFVCGETSESRDGAPGQKFLGDGFTDGEHNSHIAENYAMLINSEHHVFAAMGQPSGLPEQSYGLEFKEVLGGYVVTGMRRICIDTVLKIPAEHNGKPVIEIGPSAFELCASLTRLIIPDSVTEIGDHAFANCRSLTSVTLGRRVTTIWDNAFYNCFRLIEVNNLSTLDIVAGSPDKGLIAYYAKYIYTGEGWRSFLRTTKSGFVFYDDGETYFLVGHVSHKADLTLPKPQDGGYGIYDYALYKSAGLRSLVIPDGVTSIGTGAFFASSSLMSVIIPVSVSVVGTAAFYGCSKLADVYFAGNAEEWHKMSVGEDNEPLLYASLYWFSENPPEYVGNFWHYDEAGKPSKWILV